MPSLNRLYGRVSAVRQVRLSKATNGPRSPVSYHGTVKSLEKKGGKYATYRFRTRHKVLKNQEVMFVPTKTGAAREGTVKPLSSFGSS
tara:strand:- start:129 stop:392 length:264 start_codon:yes stop_codon:yes gene_type:complete